MKGCEWSIEKGGEGVKIHEETCCNKLIFIYIELTGCQESWSRDRLESQKFEYGFVCFALI